MNIDLNYAISLLGIIFIGVGVFIRMGNLKQVYWRSKRGMVMVSYIPLGILFIVAGFYEAASRQGSLVFYAYIALLVVVVIATVYCAARPPDFLKPDWIRWLQKYPKTVQNAMAADVEVNEQWKENVASEAAVDAWAKKLSRKLPKK